MLIEITRKWLTDRTTTGEIALNGDFCAFSLEDRLRTFGVKLVDKTAIANGTYHLVIDWSERFKRYMPHLLDVPMFTGVRIHPGNTEANTDGCILVGKQRALDEVIESRVAFIQFMARIAHSVKTDVPGRMVLELNEPTTVIISTMPLMDARLGDRGGVVANPAGEASV